MSDAEELEAARRLIGQIYDTLGRLHDGLGRTRDGLSQVRPAHPALGPVGEQLRVDQELIDATLEHIRRYGFAPE